MSREVRDAIIAAFGTGTTYLGVLSVAFTLALAVFSVWWLSVTIDLSRLFELAMGAGISLATAGVVNRIHTDKDKAP